MEKIVKYTLYAGLLLFSMAAFSSEELLRVAASKRVTADDIKNVLAAGVVVNLRNDNGETALHLLARNSGNPESIRLLIEAGANPNLASSADRTPLLSAVEKDNVSAVRALIAGGADPNFFIKSFLCPLNVAIFLGNPKIVKALIAGGADPKISVESLSGKKTNIWVSGVFAELHSKGKIRNQLNPEVITALIAGGLDPNLSYAGSRPLHDAILSNAPPQVIRALIAGGADPNLLNEGEEKELPLHLAIKTGLNPGAIRALVRGGADPNLFNEGANALHGLFYKQPLNLRVLRILIEDGKADLNLSRISTETEVIKLAPETLTVSERIKTDVGRVEYMPIFLAIDNARSPGAVRMLIQAGADVKTIPILALVVLFHSSPVARVADTISYREPMNNKIKQQIIKILLDAGADPNLRFHDQTAMEMAVEFGDKQTVRTLKNYKPRRGSGSSTTRCFMGFL